MHPTIVRQVVAQHAIDLRREATAASRARQARRARRAAHGGH
jgi:hypothetical protein